MSLYVSFVSVTFYDRKIYLKKMKTLIYSMVSFQPSLYWQNTFLKIQDTLQEIHRWPTSWKCLQFGEGTFYPVIIQCPHSLISNIHYFPVSASKVMLHWSHLLCSACTWTRPHRGVPSVAEVSLLVLKSWWPRNISHCRISFCLLCILTNSF